MWSLHDLNAIHIQKLSLITKKSCRHPINKEPKRCVLRVDWLTKGTYSANRNETLPSCSAVYEVQIRCTARKLTNRVASRTSTQCFIRVHNCKSNGRVQWGDRTTLRRQYQCPKVDWFLQGFHFLGENLSSYNDAYRQYG